MTLHILNCLIVVCIAPSDPPQELSEVSTDIRKIEISWKPPQFPNGIITGFHVSVAFYLKICYYIILQVYYNDDSLSVPTSSCNASTLTCYATINNLAPYTVYVIEVSCSTGAGEGPRTSPINVTTGIGSKLT